MKSPCKGTTDHLTVPVNLFNSHPKNAFMKILSDIISFLVFLVVVAPAAIMSS